MEVTDPPKDAEEAIKPESSNEEAKSEKTTDPSSSKMLSIDTTTAENTLYMMESSPQLSPRSTGSSTQVACRKQNPFFDKPIDCSDKTLVENRVKNRQISKTQHSLMI